MPFVTKTDLPIPTIERLEAINAQSSGLRTAADAAFLAARLPYLTNQILLKDEDNLIVIASGNTVPTSVDGFKAGALFIDLDSDAIYTNTGDETSAVWNDLNSASTVEEGTPVNAVASTGTITSNNTNVSDGDTITVNGRVYRFKNTPAAINDIDIGADADGSLTNLRSAINNTGTEGTDYYTGTTINSDVSCGAVTAHAVILTAKTKGVIGNDITLTKNAVTLTLSGLSSGKLSGGVNGTIGVANQLLADASYIYHAIAANTIADANWRRIALGSAY